MGLWLLETPRGVALLSFDPDRAPYDAMRGAPRRYRGDPVVLPRTAEEDRPGECVGRWREFEAFAQCVHRGRRIPGRAMRTVAVFVGPMWIRELAFRPHEDPAAALAEQLRSFGQMDAQEAALQAWAAQVTGLAEPGARLAAREPRVRRALVPVYESDGSFAPARASALALAELATTRMAEAAAAAQAVDAGHAVLAAQEATAAAWEACHARLLVDEPAAAVRDAAADGVVQAAQAAEAAMRERAGALAAAHYPMTAAVLGHEVTSALVHGASCQRCPNDRWCTAIASWPELSEPDIVAERFGRAYPCVLADQAGAAGTKLIAVAQILLRLDKLGYEPLDRAATVAAMERLLAYPTEPGEAALAAVGIEAWALRQADAVWAVEDVDSAPPEVWLWALLPTPERWAGFAPPDLADVIHELLTLDVESMQEVFEMWGGRDHTAPRSWW